LVSGFWVGGIGRRITIIAGIAVRHHVYVVDCLLWEVWHDGWVTVGVVGLWFSGSRYILGLLWVNIVRPPGPPDRTGSLESPACTGQPQNPVGCPRAIRTPGCCSVPECACTDEGVDRSFVGSGKAGMHARRLYRATVETDPPACSGAARFDLALWYTKPA
jgi:hypothetical protein